MPIAGSATRAASARAPSVPSEPIWRLSLEQYRKMIETGVLTDEDHVELLEGWLVAKVVKNPHHRASSRLVQIALARAVPDGWDVDKESPITLPAQDSEPEPDVVVIRGGPRRFVDRHPGPGDVALVVEVADTSLERDRGTKKALYAGAGVPAYWIVNLVEAKIEVYTRPSGRARIPEYLDRRDCGPSDEVPLVIDEVQVGTIPVKDLLP